MKVPYTNFKTREGDADEVGGCTFIGGEWKDKDTAEIFENKKVVVFALPGAFTPTCSSQQVPGYETKYDELKAQGWTSDQMAYDTRKLLHYFRLLPDRRFLFGMRGGLFATTDERHVIQNQIRAILLPLLAF